MLINSSRLAAAVCPECAMRIKKRFGIFEFSGNGSVVAHCPEKHCGAAAFEIRALKDKCKILINCPACGEKHAYTLTKRSFWGRDYICLNCPTWEVGVLHVGNDEAFIDLQMELQEDSINEILGQAAEFDDGVPVLYELIECINLLAKTDNVKCVCSAPDIAMEIDEDGIVLLCKGCGRKKVIPPTEESIDYLTETGTIVLDDTILKL